MKQTLLMMLLALGTLGTNVSAQTKKPVRKASTQTKIKASPVPKVSREYQIGEDGFEWYKICKNGKYGAEDRNGNTIVPTEYDGVKYTCFCYDCVGYSPVNAGFIARKGEYKGWYNKSGKCIIPYSRGYTYIRKYDCEDYGTHYAFTKKGGGGICDKNGKVITTVNINNLSHIEVSRTFEGEKRHYLLFFVDNGNCGVADANGKVVVFPEFEYDGHQKELESLIFARVKTTNNPFSGNTRETLAEAVGRTYNSQSSYSSSNTSSSSNSSSSNGNSGNNSTTIHVEHHHDPVPMQVWKQCTGCYGSGMCQSGCGGSGWFTGYSGNSTRCFGCGGSGKCQFCAGKGGHYEVEYR